MSEHATPSAPNHAALPPETAMVFACEGERLLGIVDAGRPDRGVVLVVGGPQVRVGRHRQFLLLARQLAAQGFPVLRVVERGMGDSGGAPRSFEAIGADIGAAIEALSVQPPQVRRIVLWGLRDGALAALLAGHPRHDPRVHGLVPLNPCVRSEASLARTHVKHNHRQRQIEREFWAKLLSGGVARRAPARLRDNLRKARGGHGPGGGAAKSLPAPHGAGLTELPRAAVAGTERQRRHLRASGVHPRRPGLGRRAGPSGAHRA